MDKTIADLPELMSIVAKVLPYYAALKGARNPSFQGKYIPRN